MSPEREPHNRQLPMPALIGLVGGAALVVAAVVGARFVSAPQVPSTPPPTPAPEASSIQTPPAARASLESHDASQVMEGYVQAALAYKRRGRLDRAIALLEDVLRQYPTASGPAALRAHYTLAWTYEAKDRKRAALREFRIVLRLAPPNSTERREAQWGIRRVTGGSWPGPAPGR